MPASRRISKGACFAAPRTSGTTWIRAVSVMVLSSEGEKHESKRRWYRPCGPDWGWCGAHRTGGDRDGGGVGLDRRGAAGHGADRLVPGLPALRPVDLQAQARLNAQRTLPSRVSMS